MPLHPAAPRFSNCRQLFDRESNKLSVINLHPVICSCLNFWHPSATAFKPLSLSFMQRETSRDCRNGSPSPNLAIPTSEIPETHELAQTVILKIICLRK